jgi:hypothetical protein
MIAYEKAVRLSSSGGKLLDNLQPSKQVLEADMNLVWGLTYQA